MTHGHRSDGGEPTPCILVVEDDALVRMVAVDTLQLMGFDVEEAGTATEAIGKLRAADGRIDGALIDIGLPDMRGDRLASELRALHAELAMVIATGYGDMALDNRFPNDGLIGFLSKPYDEVQLETTLRSVGLVARNPDQPESAA